MTTSKFDFRLLCFDYDETLAMDGKADPDSVEALKLIKQQGKRLVLVTGRILSELTDVFPAMSLCDRVVAENGGLLYDPATQQEKLLTERAPLPLIVSLRKADIPITVGRTIIASHKPYETRVLQIIRDLGVEYQIIFNKDSIMLLPSSVNKATGLKAALAELGVPAAHAAGIGDGENDHAFLALCGYSAAAAGAVESLKSAVNWVTPRQEACVKQFIDHINSIYP